MRMALIVAIAIVIALIIWAGPEKPAHVPGPDKSIGRLLIAVAILVAIAVVTAFMIYG